MLQGKVTIRRSCGDCYAQPTKEEILSKLKTDAEVTSLVARMAQRTHVTVVDAKAIAYYILAIIHGADPIEVP